MYSEQALDRLMDLDLRDYLNQVTFLDSLILLAPDQSVLWERVKPGEQPAAALLTNAPEVVAALTADPFPQDVQLLVLSPQLASPRSKLLLRISVRFFDDEPERPSSFIAVLDVQRMLAVTNSGLYSPVFTFTEISEGRYLDQYGYWVTPENQEYLEAHALFLHGGQLTTDHTSGVAIFSYLYDLRPLQGTANLLGVKLSLLVWVWCCWWC